ncbi:MAG: hypothetical protein GX567_18250 [Clostridia bacterium]|nr:hypothetical protein [Clostridia bacterium]
MNDHIIRELEIFFYSWIMGIGAAVLYDCIRIIRRIIPHGVVFIAVEDLIFWIFNSYALFIMLIQEYSGKIRWFTIVGVITGAFLYRLTISDILVGFISIIIHTIKKQLTKGIKLVKIKLCKHEGEK